MAAAGVDKAALEEELAAEEERHMVAEFRRALEYNVGKVGGTVCTSANTGRGRSCLRRLLVSFCRGAARFGVCVALCGEGVRRCGRPMLMPAFCCRHCRRPAPA
jgi:hypothetical protein